MGFTPDLDALSELAQNIFLVLALWAICTVILKSIFS
jgi:hypothetical protein